jgi:arylformamidase
VTVQRRLIDVSHHVTDGKVTDPSPSPEIGEHLTRDQAEEAYGPGVTFQIGLICMMANIGMCVDLAGLDLERLEGPPGVVVDHAGHETGADAFAELNAAGGAVLVRTGWDRHWATPQHGESIHSSRRRPRSFSRTRGRLSTASTR